MRREVVVCLEKEIFLFYNFLLEYFSSYGLVFCFVYLQY